MTGGNPFYDAFFDDLISQFPAGPLADRTTALAGASQARDMIWQTCSGVIRAGAPGRGASRNLSSILRSSRMAACSPSQRLRQNRTVSTSRPTSRAIWLLFRPAAADRMILPRRANCWGVLYRRTRVSNPCCSSGDNSTTGGFGPRIAFTTTLHLSNLNALIILLGLFSPPVLALPPLVILHLALAVRWAARRVACGAGRHYTWS